MATIKEIYNHPSIEDDSLEDSESGWSSRSQSPDITSSNNSDYWSQDSARVFSRDHSPPAYLRSKNGVRSTGFWESAEDKILAAAASTRLPTGSLSPSPSQDSLVKKEDQEIQSPAEPIPENTNNCIRFTVKAEVQHHTKPAFGYMKTKFESTTKSWTSLIGTIIITILSVAAIQSVFQPGQPLPVPDLVKVASLTKAFEPLIVYSENGFKQIGDLQETGVAIWDLGESVRSTNMISAPIIVEQLDDLSESVKTTAMELTTFFVNVNGDVDGILIVMDWAKRELSQLLSVSPSILTLGLYNFHSLFSRVGIFEGASGTPTKIGRLVTDLFGQTASQRTRRTLQHTFIEFLSALEQSVTGELTDSSILIASFESIDQQFMNLARTVARELDNQERLESDLLASLWTRVLGSNSANLRKFENNRQLLSNVRERVILNKHILVRHSGKLLNLQANLETLRKRLVSPLVRSNNSSTLSVEEQIRGLESTYAYLSGVREVQKSKAIEMLYGVSRRGKIEREGGETYEIDGGRHW